MRVGQNQKEQTNWRVTMNAEPGAQAPVELSLFMYNEGQTSMDTLVYFDNQGKRFEKQVRRSLMRDALEKLSDGKPKAVARSTGGLIAVRPMKLVLYSSLFDYPYENPEIRIRVRFKDFKANLGHPNSSGCYTEMTKDVLPADILDGFSYELGESQRFILDFGHGLIPVHVYAFDKNPENDTVAFFVEAHKVEILKGQNSILQVQRYAVPKDGLRRARDVEAGQDFSQEFKDAMKNYKQLVNDGKGVIPEFMKVGDPIFVPKDADYKSLSRILERSPKEQGSSESASEDDEILNYMSGI